MAVGSNEMATATLVGRRGKGDIGGGTAPRIALACAAVETRIRRSAGLWQRHGSSRMLRLSRLRSISTRSSSERSCLWEEAAAEVKNSHYHALGQDVIEAIQ